jgi:hypothetical protein
LLYERIVFQCAIVCVKVAQEAIDTIHKRDTTGSSEVGSLSAWWYNVHYLYTSTTVLIAARLSPSILAEVSEQSVLDGFRKATEVLDRYAAFSTSIHRLITTLQILSDTLPWQYSRLRQHLRQIDANKSSPTDIRSDGNPILQYWCPVKPTNILSSRSRGLSRHDTSESNNPASTEPLRGFDNIFDPDDFSWLTTFPLNK